MAELAFNTNGCMALPAFHTLGVISQLLHSLYALTVIALYPPIATTPSALPVMPTPDNILDHVRRTKCDILITIPALLQIWAQDKASVDLLATLKLIVSIYVVSNPCMLNFLLLCAGILRRLCTNKTRELYG